MKRIIGFLLAVILTVSVFSVSFTANAAGNTKETATSISLGKSINGILSKSNETDFYKFTLTTSGKINIKLTAYVYQTSYYLYDEVGNIVWESTGQYWNDTSKQYNKNENVYLTSGKYYFGVKYDWGEYGKYNFTLKFTSTGESFKETTGGINNTKEDSLNISLNKNYVGQLAVNDETDFYKFTLTTSGKINIKLTAYVYQTSYYLYDEIGNIVWESTGQYWNDTSKQYNKNEDVYLTSGKYYFGVKYDWGEHGKYNFTLKFTSTGESFKETTGGVNNALAESSNISLNKNYIGQLSVNDDTDFYKFKLSTSGKINIKLTAYVYETSYYLYDRSGNTVWESTGQYWNDISKKYVMNERISLKSGTYYFSVKYNWGQHGKYNFSINKVYPAPTLKTVNGKKYYVKNGVVGYKATLIFKYSGKYYYIKNGVFTKTTGLVKCGNKWYHLVKGMHNPKEKATMVKKSGKWYYCKNGVRKSTSNTLVKYKGKYYHVNKGVSNPKEKVTFVKYKGKWYYCKKGVANLKFTGKIKLKGKTVKVKKGIKK